MESRPPPKWTSPVFCWGKRNEGLPSNCAQGQVHECKGVRRGRAERSQCDVISPSHCIPLYGPEIVVTLLPRIVISCLATVQYHWLVASLLICIETLRKKTLAPCSTEKKTWQDVIDGTFLNNIFCGKELPRNKTVPPCRWFVLHQFSWWGDAVKGDPVSIEAGDRWECETRFLPE